MYETELIWYIHKKSGQPHSPFFHKSEIDLLEKWWFENTIEPKRLNLVDYARKNFPAGKVSEKYVHDEIESFINEYEICFVCSKKIYLNERTIRRIT